MQNRLIYDGQCRMCNSTVGFLKKVDSKKVLGFKPYQLMEPDEIKELKNDGIEPEKSVIYISNGRIFTKSSAIIHIFIQLKGFWGIFGVFMIIPKTLRDKIYDWIAKNRYFWFGKTDQTSCNC
ncbi:MAG: DCC1-like thiol-disulfide oxidoreductase family protein [Bacteroidales bacterium]